MVKKNPDICVVLTKVAWCDHCKDFQEIFNNIESRIKHNETLKDKKIVLEKYDMQLDESKFAKKYNQFMKKIDGYPTVLLNIKDDKNKMKGEVIEHTVIEPNNKLKKEELINIATDKFISKIESRYKSITNNEKDTFVNLEGGSNNCCTNEGCMIGGGKGIFDDKKNNNIPKTLLKSKIINSTNTTNNTNTDTNNYKYKYIKYKNKYMQLVRKNNGL
jgi:hypothetical protein